MQYHSIISSSCYCNKIMKFPWNVNCESGIFMQIRTNVLEFYDYLIFPLSLSSNFSFKILFYYEIPFWFYIFKWFVSLLKIDNLLDFRNFSKIWALFGFEIFVFLFNSKFYLWMWHLWSIDIFSLILNYFLSFQSRQS